MFGGRGFRGFVLIAIGKMEILATFPHLQDDIKVIRRYEGWYYTKLVIYMMILYFETDWSRIRPLPSTTLTLRGLSLFFKILPISNTGAYIAYILATVHFLCPKLGSFSDMEYYFYQLAYRDSKVPNRFVGLNQRQCTSYTHDFGFYSKGNASGYRQNAWAGSLKPQIEWAARGKAPFEPQLTEGHLL